LGDTHVTVFTDCTDQDAISRMITAMRITAGAKSVAPAVDMPFGKSVAGVFNTELAAAMSLVNNLYAALPPDGEEALALPVMAGNAAPRSETAGQFDNGRPFFWTRVGDSAYSPLLVMTLAPGLLSIAHRLRLLDQLHIIDTDEFLRWAVLNHKLTDVAAQRMRRTQFRGAELLPYLMRRVILNRAQMPRAVASAVSAAEVLGEPTTARGVIAQVDNFGNYVTDCLPGDIGYEPRAELVLADGRTRVICTEQLDRVPEGQLAAVIGSAGFGDQRFVTVVVKGGSAKERLRLFQGDQIFAVR
jgi:hypothetical protein